MASGRRPGARTHLLLIFGTVLVAAGALAWSTGTSPPAGAATAPARYLALGGSASVGVQPTPRVPHGQPTDQGYADDLVVAIRSRWPGITLTQLGCPGETTATMVAGGSRCRYPLGSQLSQAVEFLQTHAGTRLVTVDLGFNDIRRCFEHLLVDSACLDRGLRSLRIQLPAILSSLRAAAGPAVTIVGVGHYDPFLAAADRGPRGAAFASASLAAIERLDGLLRTIYGGFGVRLANVLGGFDSGARSGTPAVGAPPHSMAAERAQSCALTWMCRGRPYGPNLHPDDAGYRAISRAIVEALPPTH